MSEMYQGWSNYETWAFSLWMGSNTEGEYRFWREFTSHYKKDQAYELGVALADAWEERAEPIISRATVFADIVGMALRECNWREIAEYWLDEE